MGQALSSETHSISGGDGYKYWVGLQMKVQYRGCKKTVYKGILLGSGPRWGERVVVKAFTNIPGTKENWRHEVIKADVTKQMAAMFDENRRGVSQIRIIIPGIVQMDKVSKVNKWLEDRQGNKSIGRDDWVSVEEYIQGKVKRFCPWNTVHDPKEVSQSTCLEAFSHFTYLQSRGGMVACDFQGVIHDEGSSPTYVITDTILHSPAKNYGPFDKGEEGINEFFKLHKCSSLCRGWPVPTPLTPPPAFASLSLTPPPAFEDIVFPFPRQAESNITDRRRNASLREPSRSRHASGDAPFGTPSHSSNNLLNVHYPSLDHTELSRTRSYSTSRQEHERWRINSDSFNCPHDTPPSIVIPSAPPLYEDCVNSDAT